MKLDPKNTELLTQKQNLLQKSIKETEERLKTLKKASEEAAKTAGNYDKWKEAYAPIQNEITKTNQKLDTLKKKMKEMEQTGDIDTEGYKKAQTEVSELEGKLDSLRQEKKKVDEEFRHPISPEGMDDLQREIQETEIELKNLKKTAGSSSASLEKLSKSAGSFGNKAKSLGDSLMPVTAVVTAVGAASVSMANDFDDAMSQAAGALNKPMSEMEELRQLAIKTGQDTIFSATEAGNAITELAKGGLTEADIKAGALQTTMDLAASSGMKLGDAANVVVQAMGAFGLEADRSAQAANALAGAAAASSTDVAPLTEGLAQCSAQAYNAGWNIQETTAVLGRFADAGITGSDAGTSLKTMLQRLAAPTDQAAGVIEQLGIKTRDSSGNLLGAAEMAEELQNKLGGLSPASRDAALQTIFGSDAMRAATIMMNSGTEGLEKYIKATNDQDAAQRLANSQMGEGSRAIEELKGSLETAGIIIGDTIAPAIKKLAESITALVNRFTELPSGVQQAIIIFGALLAAAGPILIIIGQISLGISGLAGAFSKLSGIGGILSKIGGGLKTLFGIISANPVIVIIGVVIAAIVFLYTKCEWFRDGVNAIWSAIKDAFSAAWEGIVTFFTKTLPDAWNSVVKFFQGIPEWWAQLWESVKTTFTNAWDIIMQNPIIQGIVTMVTSLWENAKNTLKGIWDGICNIASGAWELLKNIILAPVLLLIDLVTGDFSQLASDVQNIWENIKNAASQIWDGIKQVISSIVEGIITHVTTIFKGLKDTVGNIWEAIKNTASSAWNGLKDTVLSIASNLKQAAVDAFKNMVSGIGSALSSLGKTVQSGFQSAIDFITSLPGKAIEWGKDFINGLKDGIMSGINAIVDVY